MDGKDWRSTIMKRSGAFQYPFSARLEIEGYGMGYARGIMKSNATVILRLRAEGELTTDDCRKALDIVGFEGWSYKDVQNFITGKNEEELDRRIKEEKSDRWLGLCKEGVEHIEAKLEGYEDLQDKIIQMANEMHLFEKSILYPQTAYGSVIAVARGIRNRVYSRYTTKGLVELLGMDETTITNIMKSIQSIDFDIYGQAFSEDKLKDQYLYVISVRLKEVSVCIAELIYRMVIYDADIDVVNCVSDLLAFDDNYKGEILELVSELLKEHIRRMNKVIKTIGYPVEAILQMMDYPALNQKEYEQCMATIIEILERL